MQKWRVAGAARGASWFGVSDGGEMVGLGIDSTTREQDGEVEGVDDEG